MQNCQRTLQRTQKLCLQNKEKTLLDKTFYEKKHQDSYKLSLNWVFDLQIIRDKAKSSTFTL